MISCLFYRNKFILLEIPAKRLSLARLTNGNHPTTMRAHYVRAVATVYLAQAPEPRFLFWIHGGGEDDLPATAAEVSSLGLGVVGAGRP